MCDIKNCKFDKEYEITCEEIKNIIDEMAALKIPDLVLTGGEPFLYSGIFEIIAYAKDKGRKVIMITNGFYEKNIVEKIVNSEVDHLQVSLDGSTAQIYECIRGVKGSFDVVINNIKKFIANGKSVGVTATITRQNYKDLVNIAQLSQGLGCRRLALRPAHVSNADPLRRDFSENSFWIPPSEKDFFEKICEDLEIFNKATNFLDFCPGVKLLPQYFNDGYSSSKGSCFIGFTRLIISYNEQKSYGVWMCRDMIGDIRKKTLREIWYGQEARRMRKIIKRCEKVCLFPEMHEPELINITSLVKKIANGILRKVT
ncbi:radical SAM protein [Patescibacteria group bacterium]|nr:radical SAM protein [Patescibacteria group bacterium]